jgi:hypothetical protein
MIGAVIVKVALRRAMDYLTQRGIGRERGAAECCRESEGVPQTPLFLAPKSGGKGVESQYCHNREERSCHWRHEPEQRLVYPEGNDRREGRVPFPRA